MVFTVEYVKEKDVSQFLDAERFRAVEAVRQSGKYEIRYELSKPFATWRNSILRPIIVPEHIWADVEDSSARDPPTDGDPIGTGASVLEEFDPKPDVWAALTPPENGSEIYSIPEDVSFLEDTPPYSTNC